VVLTKMSGGAVVIVGTDRIHRPQLQQSLQSLETADAHVFGIVVNKLARREATSYGYGYGKEYTSAAHKPQRPNTVQPRRRRDWDDTLMFDAVPQNGHKAGTSRAR